MQNNWVAIFSVFKGWKIAQVHLSVLFTFCVHPNDLFFLVWTSSQSLQLPRDLNKQQNKVEQECLLFLPRLDWNQMYSRTECMCSPFQNSTTQEESNSNPKLHPPERPEAMLQYLYWQSTRGILTKPKPTLSRTALGLEPHLYQTVPAYTLFRPYNLLYLQQQNVTDKCNIQWLWLWYRSLVYACSQGLLKPWLNISHGTPVIPYIPCKWWTSLLMPRILRPGEVSVTDLLTEMIGE